MPFAEVVFFEAQGRQEQEATPLNEVSLFGPLGELFIASAEDIKVLGDLQSKQPEETQEDIKHTDWNKIRESATTISS